jgi:hypothetical protein
VKNVRFKDTQSKIPQGHSLSDYFTRHRSFSHINQGISPKRIDLYAQLILHELDRFPACQTIARDNGCGVDLRLDELIRTTKELRSNNHHRRCAITNFLVLLLSKINKYTTSRVFNRQKGKDGGAVIGDGDFLYSRFIEIGMG